jgi:hypothetical protein
LSVKSRVRNHFLTSLLEKIRQSKRGKNESAVVDEGDEEDESDADNTPGGKASIKLSNQINRQETSKKIQDGAPNKKSS